MALTTTTYKNLTHADTILYEFNMLRHACSKLNEHKWDCERDAWVYLESFLLHFRNVIEFFGHKNPRTGDLHVNKIWTLVGINPPANLSTIHADGVRLHERYEPSEKLGGGRISQFLSHCTEKRTDPRIWMYNQMLEEVEPLIAQVEPMLQPKATREFQTVVAVPRTNRYPRVGGSMQVGTLTGNMVRSADASNTVSDGPLFKIG
jgi:hypothetical protein